MCVGKCQGKHELEWTKLHGEKKALFLDWVLNLSVIIKTWSSAMSLKVDMMSTGKEVNDTGGLKLIHQSQLITDK